MYMYIPLKKIAKTMTFYTYMYIPLKLFPLHKSISGSPDTITCGQCLESFPLDNFLAFIQHKGAHILRIQVESPIKKCLLFNQNFQPKNTLQDENIMDKRHCLTAPDHRSTGPFAGDKIVYFKLETDFENIS